MPTQFIFFFLWVSFHLCFNANIAMAKVCFSVYLQWYSVMTSEWPSVCVYVYVWMCKCVCMCWSIKQPFGLPLHLPSATFLCPTVHLYSILLPHMAATSHLFSSFHFINKSPFLINIPLCYSLHSCSFLPFPLCLNISVIWQLFPGRGFCDLICFSGISVFIQFIQSGGDDCSWADWV